MRYIYLYVSPASPLIIEKLEGRKGIELTNTGLTGKNIIWCEEKGNHFGEEPLCCSW